MKLTDLNSMEGIALEIFTGVTGSLTIGCRSNTSKTRSNDTSADMMSTRTLDSAVSGPYSRARRAVIASKVPIVISFLIARCPPIP